MAFVSENFLSEDRPYSEIPHIVMLRSIQSKYFRDRMYISAQYNLEMI